MFVHPSGPPSPLTVSDLGERALIERIRARVGSPAAWTVVGLGDDAAVVAPVRGELDVLTTDTLVEDVHFRRAWTLPDLIGRKAVAINLSDLAAMGATPRAVLLGLCLPDALPIEDFDAVIDGVIAEATAARAALVGGNISRSPGPLIVDVTATGSVHRRRMLTRVGGKAGDELYVTGEVGGAATGLALLQDGIARDGLEQALTDCLARFERPEARLRCGRLVAGHRAASACMDLSDGLADAAHQVAQASGTGVVIEAEAIPVHEGARLWGHRRDLDPLLLALTGGEDYELLFAVPQKGRRAFLAAMQRCRPATAVKVGTLTKEPQALLMRDGKTGPLPAGFAHFGNK